VAENNEKRQEDIKRRFARINIALAVLIIIATGLGVVKWLAVPSGENPPKSSVPWKTITVNISGAVKNPGSYKLFAADTLRELVMIAGGFDEGADTESVNLSTPLEGYPGNIIIPYAIKPEPPQKPPAPGEVKFPLNINEATVLELQALPGIGPVFAKRIVEYREKHGPFQKTSELMNVEGIGEKIYEDLFGLITVGGGLPWEQEPEKRR